jgi:hypothetical protein
MKIHTLLLIILLCLNSAACVSPDSKQSTGVKINPTKNNDANEFLIFAETFSNLSPDAQKQELVETNQALALNPNELLCHMKLVMIYGLPSSSLPDTAKAQNLLQQLLQEDILSNSQLAFAHVLFDYLVATNKVSKNNHALQLKLDAAQQKLDDLKKIEKSMGEREILPKK